jgi:hypothetical protein
MLIYGRTPDDYKTLIKSKKKLILLALVLLILYGVSTIESRVKCSLSDLSAVEKIVK